MRESGPETRPDRKDRMKLLLRKLGGNPMLWLLVFVPAVFVAAELASGARKDRLYLSVGIALGSASQIALFVAPVLVLLSYVIGPTPPPPG